ncbi:hypothetical protein PGUG_03552 [Meyerozyma guilliermondii ATCC 6260]|uniref:DNA-binding protein RAP1 n=1 Tax=Meyerozyma guilliermondii (strain ATCC 6260 / CBS 566 / DSM 6381 / JCM 1539 / NBRC 10279 / NRRL Y-324) TaxID=294746 RepID=A5DJV1_PICGU|nr:uncharacterized protein PGUG_03552 [Meyerozyma guilliermondii ATCC 6260]EDK39454.2 hypothetical protein PGUG_03552 [Meyerozyma guilliermondii ATCC 6260]
MSFHGIEYSPEMVANATTVADDGMPSIFNFPGGNPMLFYIAPDEPLRNEYVHKITNYGGVIADTEPRPSNQIILLSSYHLGHRSAYKFSFVDDSIEQGAVQNLDNYRFGYEGEADDATNHAYEAIKAVGSSPGRTVRNGRITHRFNKVKDDYILKQVRMHPKYRNSHKFFDDLANHPQLEGHTGNSIRSRFRTHLEPKLDWVYKTASDGSLIKDEHGQLIRDTLDNLPKTLKNRFTAEEDYELCQAIVDFNRARFFGAADEHGIVRDETGKPKEFDLYGQLTVPISFFSTLAKTNPMHTPNSWRDRYRKFVSRYGAKKYIDYYDKVTASGGVPEPIKGDSPSTAKAIKQLIGSNYRKDTQSALDEEISQLKSSNIDSAIIAQSQIAPEPLVKFIDRGATLESLISNAFFQVPQEEVEPRITEILESCSQDDISVLIEKLKATGFEPNFTAHIVMATNGDVAKMQEYVHEFLQRMNTQAIADPYELAQISRNGIWTPETDAMLCSGNPADIKRLQQTHDHDEIKRRGNFLKSIGVSVP